jgi:hypothetical protein
MPHDSEYAGLAEEFARSRAAAIGKPVTLDDCRRVLAMLRDTSVVDRATIIRCMEFLLDERRRTQENPKE